MKGESSKSKRQAAGEDEESSPSEGEADQGEELPTIETLPNEEQGGSDEASEAHQDDEEDGDEEEG